MIFVVFMLAAIKQGTKSIQVIKVLYWNGKLHWNQPKYLSFEM